MFPSLHWSLNCFLTLWVIINTLFMVVVGPRFWQFMSEEYAGAFPFDWPVWAYRLRRWGRRVVRRFRRRASLIWHMVARWWNTRADDRGGAVIVVIMLGLVFIGLIITAR